jgi:hypothetical protein
MEDLSVSGSANAEINQIINSEMLDKRVPDSFFPPPIAAAGGNVDVESELASMVEAGIVTGESFRAEGNEQSPYHQLQRPGSSAGASVSIMA